MTHIQISVLIIPEFGCDYSCAILYLYQYLKNTSVAIILYYHILKHITGDIVSGLKLGLFSWKRTFLLIQELVLIISSVIIILEEWVRRNQVIWIQCNLKEAKCFGSFFWVFSFWYLSEFAFMDVAKMKSQMRKTRRSY